jgi:hypothetical protein
MANLEKTCVTESEQRMKSYIDKKMNRVIKERAEKAAKYSEPENVKAAYAYIFGLEG